MFVQLKGVEFCQMYSSPSLINHVGFVLYSINTVYDMDQILDDKSTLDSYDKP